MSKSELNLWETAFKSKKTKLSNILGKVIQTFEKHPYLIIAIILISIFVLFVFGIEIAIIYAWGIPIALLLHYTAYHNKIHWGKAGLQSWFYVVKAVKKF